MSKVLFPGVFDPITNGHVNLISRAIPLCSELIVGVYENPNKKQVMFNTEERVLMAREAIYEALGDVSAIKIKPYSGLTVTAAKLESAKFIMRGLRIGSDFEYEREMALTNRGLDPEVDTICLMSSLEYQFLSSSRVKEVARLGGDVSSMVPKNVLRMLIERREQNSL